MFNFLPHNRSCPILSFFFNTGLRLFLFCMWLLWCFLLLSVYKSNPSLQILFLNNSTKVIPPLLWLLNIHWQPVELHSLSFLLIPVKSVKFNASMRCFLHWFFFPEWIPLSLLLEWVCLYKANTAEGILGSAWRVRKLQFVDKFGRIYLLLERHRSY